LSPREARESASGAADWGGADGASLAPLQVYADLTVFLDDEPGAAAARRERLDAAAGKPYESNTARSDTAIFAGTPAELADLLLDWRAAGLDGFRLRPGTLPHDLTGITRGLVPELRRKGVFRNSYAEATLRERLGLPRPVNRYSKAASA
jgi:alkanesulfonate monooxygenase SsuD/methylene tetrahydromethanopterin reductase-like flavin-dependent oxidoreductase (luciferase family)